MITALLDILGRRLFLTLPFRALGFLARPGLSRGRVPRGVPARGFPFEPDLRAAFSRRVPLGPFDPPPSVRRAPRIAAPRETRSYPRKRRRMLLPSQVDVGRA